MRRIVKSLLVVSGFCVLFSCKDDNDRDDTILNMSDLTGKYWYYNQWRGDKDSYLKEDVLEVLKFEKNGELVSMDFGGTENYGSGKMDFVRQRDKSGL